MYKFGLWVCRQIYKKKVWTNDPKFFLFANTQPPKLPLRFENKKSARDWLRVLLSEALHFHEWKSLLNSVAKFPV